VLYTSVLSIYRTGLISSLMGEKSVTQRWEVSESTTFFDGVLNFV
jgi:hypothetical protein